MRATRFLLGPPCPISKLITLLGRVARCLAGRRAVSPQDRACAVRIGTSRMSYSVKELFKTLQGEGAQAGRAAVFCRFAGCNLWTGREEDRASAVCTFCDTDFVGTDGAGGGKFAGAEALADAIVRTWDNAPG